MSWPAPIRIVGIGSPHGDDALGWEAVRMLRERIGERPGVETYLANGGQRLLELLDGRGTLLVIDAMQSGAAPGTIHRLKWPDPRLESMLARSTHDLGLVDALNLAHTLFIAPACTIVVAMEMESAKLNQGLSEAVQEQLEKLVGLIGQTLEGPDRPVQIDHNNSHA
jgi:hydrogenase maturation protease